MGMSETSLPQYDELYVVSDLHMGGRGGFQILKECRRLAEFTRWVGRQRPDGRVALVLNGDVIDSLSEDIGGYIAADEAVTMVTRIFNDEAFAPVWEALKDFVGRAGRSLILVIGNHDIEVALPSVQGAIEARLAGDDAAARGRITFSTSGAGYSCEVGDARVFCIHGNEQDSWNVVDYEALFQLARGQNAGIPFDSKGWKANAGTILVKDIMNEIKKKYAWIDLLKPETKAAIGVLVVLDPGQVGKISRGIPVLWEKLRGTLKLHGLLSADETTVADAGQVQTLAMNELLGPNLLDGLQAARSSSGRSADSMLLEAEKTFDKGNVRPPGSDQTLGWGQLVWDWLTGVEKPEALRRALKDWLRGDKTFDITDRDETFEGVTAKVGPGVDFIVTGHTHLERAIKLDARRYYFNSGTWIRLLHIKETTLEKPAEFQKVYDVLMKGSMGEIDRAQIGQPFLLNQTSAVSIKEEGNEVVGQLLHIEDGNPLTRKVISEFRRR
jgi:UDP-2,3-diacylglucosamine pyrophosphatase LpxH